MRTLQRAESTPGTQDDPRPSSLQPEGDRADVGGAPRTHAVMLLDTRIAGALAEASLTLVTLAAVVGFARLFAGASFLPVVAGAALASHLVAAVSRRVGHSGVVTTALSAVALLLYVTWVVEPHTSAFGLPGSSTWAAVLDDLRTAWEQFGEVVAPAAVSRGFVLAAVVATWAAAWLADMFAFRVQARFEAVVPSFTLFLFGGILGADRHRIAVTTLYLAALLGFVVLADVRARAGSEHWFGTRGNGRNGSTIRAAALLGTIVVLSAALVGPRLPGAGERSLVGLEERSGAGRSERVTVSPLVDIRGRLVDPSGAEVFSVASASPAYWRLTSLDRFDGEIWSSRDTYERAEHTLPRGITTTGAEEVLVQEFAIGRLSSIWLPAAFRPQRVDGDVPGLSYERDSASLLTERDTADGLAYSVESATPQHTAAGLAGAPVSVPEDVAERYLSLPADFPEAVRAQAGVVVSGNTAPYDQARALQDWFRANFTYSLDIPAGHGGDAMINFLENRVGYCEQFAGTYAAMARSVGIPARVAVGFTPGPLGDDGRYHVTDGEAHAWPEVFLNGFGWVSFEPTPGRGQPGAQDYTQVAPPVSETPATPTTTPASEAQPGGGAGGTTPTTTADGEIAATDAVVDGPGRSAAGIALRAALAALVLLPLAALAAVPLARRSARRRRRMSASTPAERVLVAWDEAEEDLAAAGLRRRRWETAPEYSARVGPVGGPQVSENLQVLTARVEVASWSREGVEAGEADRAETAATGVATAVRSGTHLLQRFMWAVDPRPLLQRRR